MSGQGRHDPYKVTSSQQTPSSYAYVDQMMSGRQYLHPEDVYRHDRDDSYYNPTSYPQSRHSSDPNSPRHSTTSADAPGRHSSDVQSPYVEYPYTQLSRHGGETDSGMGSSRRVTPPDEGDCASRHGQSASHERRRSSEHGGRSSSENSPKSKGKEKERDVGRYSDSNRGASAGQRHNSGDGRRNRRGSSRGRLVSGVFIRY